MKKKIASILRRWAEKLSPMPVLASIPPPPKKKIPIYPGHVRVLTFSAKTSAKTSEADQFFLSFSGILKKRAIERLMIRLSESNAIHIHKKIDLETGAMEITAMIDVADMYGTIKYREA